MQALNMITKCVAKVFLVKAEEFEFEMHPYYNLALPERKAGEHEWTTESKQQAIDNITTWVKHMFGNACASALNDILEVCLAADRGDDASKKAANETRDSIKFLEMCLTSAMKEVNAEHVAEQLFTHGHEKAARLAAETAQKTVKKIHNWTTRIAPSAN